jgi:hypothetical protein
MLFKIQKSEKYFTQANFNQTIFNSNITFLFNKNVFFRYEKVLLRLHTEGSLFLSFRMTKKRDPQYKRHFGRLIAVTPFIMPVTMPMFAPFLFAIPLIIFGRFATTRRGIFPKARRPHVIAHIIVPKPTPFVPNIVGTRARRLPNFLAWRRRRRQINPNRHQLRGTFDAQKAQTRDD